MRGIILFELLLQILFAKCCKQKILNYLKTIIKWSCNINITFFIFGTFMALINGQYLWTYDGFSFIGTALCLIYAACFTLYQFGAFYINVWIKSGADEKFKLIQPYIPCLQLLSNVAGDIASGIGGGKGGGKGNENNLKDAGNALSAVKNISHGKMPSLGNTLSAVKGLSNIKLPKNVGSSPKHRG